MPRPAPSAFGRAIARPSIEAASASDALPKITATFGRAIARPSIEASRRYVACAAALSGLAGQLLGPPLKLADPCAAEHRRQVWPGNCSALH